MEIQSIEIVNFRPYRDVEADFTADDGHIHIIEGSQGAGKTSFHRAVQWGLYGADGPAANYRTNWNDEARKNKDEQMEVTIKFADSGQSYVLRRDISNFDHEGRRATSRVRLITGEEELHAEDAEDFINSRVPEDLKDFFFLDGEEIQELIDENKGREVKEEIEKVLKHTAILNARDDLDTLLSDKYRSRRDELEAEHEERKELKQKITQKQDEKAELRRKKSSLESERESVKSSIEEARELLEERNQEAMEEIEQVEADITKLAQRKMTVVDRLETAWGALPMAILSKEMETTIADLKHEEERCKQLLAEAQESEVIARLVEEAKEGECPICGSTHGDPVSQHRAGGKVDTSQAELQARQVEARDRLHILKRAPELETPPSALEDELIDIRDELERKRDERDRLLEEHGGGISESEKGRLKDSLDQLEQRRRDLNDKIAQLQEDIKDTQREIDKLKRDRRGLAGGSELEEIDAKIQAAECAKDALRDVREAHIQAKREKIKQEMTSVFDKVSQSEFIRGRYSGIDFKGEADDDDEYVLQLVKSDGSRKRMDQHPPSAGETQLTALSFIFGLNKYAKYSTTIVFDTVAGRLDLRNSHAQGKFFSTLDEPIILLVTDAEFEKLGDAIRDDIGTYYRIRPDESLNSTLEEVTDA